MAGGNISAQTTDDRLRAKIQENISNPWPGISDPNNSAGVFSYALACLYLNTNVAQANNLIVDLYTNNPVPATTSIDYGSYFWQHIMWRIYHDASMNARLTVQARNLIEDNMWRWLQARSKVTEAQQSEWMIDDSENHDAMQKGSHLLCLIALNNSSRYGPGMVLGDGKNIAEHKAAWTGFYMRYFRSRAREGINVEIASPIYAKYSMGAYYNIMDFSDSPELRTLVKSFIDLYWADTASDWLSSGVRGGGETRCYKDNYLYLGTTYSFHSLLWAYGWHANEASIRTYPMIAAVSPYRIPDIITASATDPARPNFLYSSRRFGRGGAWDGNRNYTVVFDSGNSNLRRDTFVTPDYSMGTFTVDMNRGYIALLGQNRAMGVMFAAGVNERIMLFGKGGTDPTKSFSDISGVTRENCMVVQRDQNASSHGNATQLYISPVAWANRVETGGWFFTQLNGAYCAIKPANGGYTSATAGSGVNLTLDDLWAPVVIQTGQASAYTDFAAFQNSVSQNAFTYASSTLNYTSEAGDVFTFYANSKTTPKVNGSTVNLNPAKTYDSPYLSMTHGEETATLRYPGYSDVILDFGYDPNINSLSPMDNATGVSVGGNLVVSFNEPVVAGTGSIVIRRADDHSLVESIDVTNSQKVSISNAQVTLNPSADLMSGTEYYVTIDATCFDDLQGHSFAGLSQPTDWNFTTQSARPIVPLNTASKVVASSLGNGSTSLSFDAGASADMLMVAISAERSTETTYSVSYDGKPLSMAVESVQAGIWYLDLRATDYNGGVKNLVVDFTGITTVNGVAIGAVSVSANGYAIEVHATASGIDSVLLSTTRDETFNLVSFNANGSGTPTVNAPLTTLYANGNIGSAQGAAGYQTSVTAGNHNYSWTTTDQRKVVAAAFVVSDNYTNWSMDYALGTKSGLTDDADSDGIPNGIEAWFGTRPDVFSQGLVAGVASSNSLSFTHPHHANAPANLVATYRWSKDLVVFNQDGVTDGAGTRVDFSILANTPATGISTVTATATGTPTEKLFVDIQVTQEP